MLVLPLGAQGLVLAEVFFFAVLHSGVLLPVCALIRLVSAFNIPNFWTGCVCRDYLFRARTSEELEFCFKQFPCCFRIVSSILKCASIKLFVSAIKSASDSNEELNS